MILLTIWWVKFIWIFVLGEMGLGHGSWIIGYGTWDMGQELPCISSKVFCLTLNFNGPFVMSCWIFFSHCKIFIWFYIWVRVSCFISSSASFSLATLPNDQLHDTLESGFYCNLWQHSQSRQSIVRNKIAERTSKL